MPQLVGVIYESAEQSGFALRRLSRLSADSEQRLDALAVRRDEDGKVALEVPGPGSGLALRPFWRPFVALLGAAAGPQTAPRPAAGEIAIWLGRTGLDPAFMQELARTLTPGSAGLFLVAPIRTVQRLAPLLGRDGGVMFYAAVAGAEMSGTVRSPAGLASPVGLAA